MSPLFRRRRTNSELADLHEAQRRRARGPGGTYVADLVLGANDGVITTFAIVAAATGGRLDAIVILILGFANLFADGVSMAASNFLGKRSSMDYVRSQCESEEWAVENVPWQEKDEVREIFRRKGLQGEQLEAVVDGIVQSKSAWIDVMMAHELGLEQASVSPWRHGFATFIAFVAAGMAPLAPYLFCTGPRCFALSATAAGVALFVAGALRTFITTANWLRAGAEMFAVGAAAAAVAYGSGLLISLLI